MYVFFFFKFSSFVSVLQVSNTNKSIALKIDLRQFTVSVQYPALGLDCIAKN